MKLKIKSIVVYSAFLLTFLALTSCGDSAEKSPEVKVVVEQPILTAPEQEIPTFNANSLQTINFDYETISYSQLSQAAIATIALPDETKTVIGNITLALDVIDLAGIEQISLDFSNGNSDILALQVCGGVSASCNNEHQTDNTSYRLFINGINPHDYAWKNGPNVIKVWVDNLQGERSIAATFTINWQAVVIAQTTAEFVNVVINQSTGEGTADLEISWTKLPGYLFYNAFISTEPGINSDNFSSLNEGQARLSLVDNSIVFEGIDANQEYYFTISGVDDGGESAFSTQRSVIDLSRGAPAVIDDIADMEENTGIIVNVLGNDSSSNNQLTIVSFTQGQNGLVTDNGDGTLTYLHDGSETTSDQFTYKVNNGISNSATAIVNIRIALVNDAPIGVEDEAIVNEGETVLIDIKSNDSDEESLNSSLTITNVSNGDNGTVVNNNDGTVSYSHNGSESLSDNFTYIVSDGVNHSAPVTVSLTINPLNDAPIANNDSGSVNEGNSVVLNLRNNDRDAESATNTLIVANLTPANHGSVVNNNDGTVTYTHNGSESTFDSFTYIVSDGALTSTPASVSVTITPVNDTPIANNDSGIVNEGNSVLLNLRNNDSDAESATNTLIITNLTPAMHGTVVNNNDGTVTYIHNGSETSFDSFTYTVSDGELTSTPASVSVTITPVNDTPIANNDSGIVNEGNSVLLNLRNNDSDAESATNTLAITNLTPATHGSVVNNNDGTVTYTHNGSETSFDSFTYTVSDGALTSTPASVSITISPVNDAPVANSDSGSVNEGNSVVLNLRNNDSDAESANNTLTITNLTSATNGTVVNNNDGTVTYTHNGSETSFDSFTYTVSDGALTSTPASVSVTISPVNDAPIANNDSGFVNQGSSVVLNLRNNDSDAESATNTLTITNLTSATNGTVVNNNDGSVTYTHDGSQTSLDTFTYTVSDGVLTSTPASVSVTITSVNTAPIANNDSGIVNEGNSLVLNLRNNDSDAESATNTLIITNLTPATYGSVVNNNDGTVTYTHNGSETTLDAFTYTVSDGTLTSAPANVSVTITPVNDAPVITSNNVVNLPENTANTTAVYSALANDSESDTLTWSLLDSQNIFIIDSVTGVITVNDNRTLDYETLSPYNLQLTVTDNGAPSASDTILIAVTLSDVNEKPLLTAAPSITAIAENAQVADAITSITANDPEGDGQTWSITAGNIDGVFGIDTAGNVTVVDITELNYEATMQYVLTVKAEDASAATIFSTIDIQVDITDVVENQELMFDPLFGNNGESSFNTYSYASEDSIVNTVRQSDGKLVMVVNTLIAGVENIAAIRVHPNGSVDTSYGDNGRKTFKFSNSQKASRAIIDVADSIYIVGTETNSNAYPFVVKVDANGNLDTSFSLDGKFEYLLFPDDTYGVDIHLHSNGYVYLASEGFSSNIGNLVLKLLRIDTAGNIAVLNADAGAAEFDLFAFNDFFPVGLDEISTGELVVFGTDFDGELMDANFAAAVLNAADLSQPSVTTGTFDIQQTLTASGSSDDKVQTYLRVINDNFIIAGSSKYLQGVSGPDEATLIKVAVSNLAISIDASYALSGVFTADIDSDINAASFIESLTFDSNNKITFVAASIVSGDGDDIYIVEQLTDTGAINGAFNPQTVVGNTPWNAGSNLIIDPSNSNLYLASNTGAITNDDISFQQFLNDGTEVLPSYHRVNFTASNESLIDINLLSVLPERGALWINSYKPIDVNNASGSISLVTNNGQVDDTINQGISTLQAANISYGPSLELSDGSIIYTTLDMSTYDLTIYKIIDKNFTADVNFVPSFGYTQVSLPIGSTLSAVAYDSLNNQVVLSGTVFSSGNSAFLVKLNATDGTLFNGGNFSNGIAPITIGSNAIFTFERVLPQPDGTLFGLGNTVQAGFEQPFLVKLTANGVLDTGFNSTGYKIFNLAMPSADLSAIDILQLSDDSLIFSVNNLTSLTAHLVKVNSAGVLDASFATAGVLNLAIGASSTVINDIALDADENIYAVGFATNTDDDNLVVKIISVDGSLDTVFNAYTTPGYWMFDEGGTEQINKVLFDEFVERIVLGSTITGPTGNTDIRLNTFNLIQNDN